MYTIPTIKAAAIEKIEKELNVSILSNETKLTISDKTFLHDLAKSNNFRKSATACYSLGTCYFLHLQKQAVRQLKSIKEIEISGRLWFQKSGGNTYHNAKCWVENTSFTTARQYGYGDSYIYTTLEKVFCFKTNFRDFENYNIKTTFYKEDVKREKDLY